MRRLALVLCLIATPALADDPGAAIEVGRFGVMLDQIQAAERLVASAPAPVPTETAPMPDDLYQQLVAIVVRFNAISQRVCGEVALPAADCAGPFAPAWLKAGATSDPARLRPMIDEAGARIGAFWGDMCALARAKDEHLCDIE
jgi:hypothetical protein